MAHTAHVSGNGPLLIQRWEYLWRNEFVELRRGPSVTGSGWIDEITDDGMVIWIHLTDAKGRVMIHRKDGIDIWRIEATPAFAYLGP